VPHLFRQLRATVSDPQRLPEKCSARRFIEAVFVVRPSRLGHFWLAGEFRFGRAVPHLGSTGRSEKVDRWNRGSIMMKIVVLAMAASFAMVSVASAADLPRRQPPPVAAAPVGKYPVGKYPVGKYPVGKYPQPVVTKG
jgi:hypothetical protein